MASVNWAGMRDSYEIMHLSVKELALSHNVSESMVNLAVQNGNWERLDENVEEAEILSAKLLRVQSRNEAELTTKFISLQAKMLDKCNTLIDDAEGLNDAHNLKIVSDIIEKHRPHIMQEKKNAVADNQMNIRIMTQAGAGDEPSIAAVQITGSAGASNGIGQVDVN